MTIFFSQNLLYFRFLVSTTYTRKFHGTFFKIVAFFLMSNFWRSFLCFLVQSKTREITTKN